MHKKKLTSLGILFTNEPGHNKTHKIICGYSKDTDLPVYQHSIIRAFPVCLKKNWVLIKLSTHDLVKTDQTEQVCWLI